MQGKPAAGYYRVSVAREGMKAPELYREEIERYCAYRGVPLGKIFSDIDQSGFRGAKRRPGLEELKLNMRRFSFVVVPKMSRCSRSMRELIELFDLFDQSDIPLVFLDMNVDTSTSQGRLLRHVMAAFAEYESDVRADYARASHRLAAAAGRPRSLPPFGYVSRDHTYLIDSRPADAVQRIFQRYTEGASQYAIAQELTEAQIMHGDRLFTAKAVGRILDNPGYVARSMLDGKEVPANWEPIITDETWRAVRTRREADSRRISLIRSQRRGPYLLTGLLFCGYCGRRLTHQARSNPVYLCCGRIGDKRCPGGSVGAERAEAFVTDRFLDRCRFTLGGTFQSDQGVAWKEASLLQRRSLLAMAIAKVVVAPWPGGDKPIRSPGAARDLRIVWTTGPSDRTTLFAGTRPPEQRQLRHVQNGRYEATRAAEAAQVEERRQRRAQASRRYFIERRREIERLRQALADSASQSTRAEGSRETGQT